MKLDLFGMYEFDFVWHVRRRNDDGLFELLLESFLEHLHVKEAKEADAVALTKSGRTVVGQRDTRVVYAQLLYCLTQQVEGGRVLWKEPGENLLYLN